MKKHALTYLGCIAALSFGSACSQDPKSKKEGGHNPVPYIETRPNIVETATNAEGGLILGKKPNEIDVVATVNPNATNRNPIDLRTYSIAGISINSPPQEIIDRVGAFRLINAASGTYYVFDDSGLVVGFAAGAPASLKDSPSFMYTTRDFGYKGLIAAPESLGSIQVGKQVLNGTATNLVAIEKFALTLGAFNQKQDPDTYNCFYTGTCYAVRQESGDFLVAFPQALITLTSEGIVDTIEIRKSVLGLPKMPPSTQVIEYGKSIANLSLSATAKQFQLIFGPDANGAYVDGTVITTRDDKGLLDLFGVTNFDGIIFSSSGKFAGIQFGDPIEGTFDCKNLVEKSITSLDSTVKAESVPCETDEKSVTVGLPGAVLTFIQSTDPSTGNAVTMLGGYIHKVRPVIYGAAVAGLSLGLDEKQTAELYGPLPKTADIVSANGEVLLMDGLTVTFGPANGKLVIKGITADSSYRGEVFDLTGDLRAILGNETELRFNGESASRESFQAFAQTLEGSYRLKTQNSTENKDAAPVFKAENECSFAAIKTPSCYFESKTIDGVQVYSIVLPHMSFEFNASNTLTRVSL